MRNFLLIATAVLIAPLAGAQSLNIDFNWNGVGTIPNSSYAAAGLAGVWNNANVSTNSIINLSLVDLAGSGTSAVLNIPNFGGSCATSGPWTGNDESLMEDLVGSGSNPGVISFSGLLAGNYAVTLYGMNATGNSNSTFTINNVTQNTGGAWSGSHVLGASYTTFANILITGGNLSIGYTGNCNGIQLNFHPVPEPLTILTLLSGVAAVASRRKKGKN